MNRLEIRDLSKAFGSEVVGLEPKIPLDADTCQLLQRVFDERGLLLFRGLDIDKASQVYLSKMLVRKDTVADDPTADDVDIEHEMYISNKRTKGIAPFGRLQFHTDAMWCDQPVEVLSLYGEDVEEPVVPTIFVSAVNGWNTLPAGLRQRVHGLSASHTAGQLRRGDLTDVLVATFQNARSTVAPIEFRHPRTGQTLLYVCEQMTQEIVDLLPDEGEPLIQEIFDHMYQPDNQWSLYWRKGDLAVWDNISIQHARPNVMTDGPARTLRKFLFPSPKMSPEQLPTFSNAG
jgi:alpha-ketoglutarate-dependent taurine dioxygenase